MRDDCKFVNWQKVKVQESSDEVIGLLVFMSSSVCLQQSESQNARSCITHTALFPCCFDWLLTGSCLNLFVKNQSAC